jgi:hypothetical protein
MAKANTDTFSGSAVASLRSATTTQSPRIRIFSAQTGGEEAERCEILPLAPQRDSHPRLVFASGYDSAAG